MLPVSVRSYYDPEDMIADVAFHVFKKSGLFNPEKARESTWVQHVTDNKCKSILAHHTAQRYSACETVELTSEVWSGVRAPSTLALREAKSAVERVIQFGSDEVREFLDLLFNGGLITCVPVYALREAARKSGATRQDFELVFRLVAS